MGLPRHPLTANARRGEDRKVFVEEPGDAVVQGDIDELAAQRARAQIQSALHLLGSHGHDPHDTSVWQPQVLQLSALKGTGLADFWAAVTRFRTLQTDNGRFAARRHTQDQAWMWDRIDAGLRQRFRAHPAVRQALPALSQAVMAGTLAASVAARRLLDLAH